METSRVIPFQLPRSLAVLACLAALAGCSSVENFLSGDKVDYRSTSSTRPAALEVPPDLTQLAKETRYQQPNGTISASTFQAQGTAAAASAPTMVATIAPQAVGDFKIERLGNERWLSTTLSPEQVYPQVRTFWKDNGFNLVQDRPETGVVETDWAVAAFTMNWKFTAPGIRVRFEKDEPFCFFFPIPRGNLDEIQPQIRSLGDADNDTFKGYTAFRDSRAQFIDTLQIPGSDASRAKWERTYFQGGRPDGLKGAEDHQTRIRLKPFQR